MADDREKHEVGYGKPPKHTQFKKGQSGNPKGRPKAPRNVSQLLERELNQRVEVIESGRRKRISKFEAITKALVNNAMRGDIRSQKIVLEERRKTEPPPGQMQRIPIALAREIIDRAYAPQNIPDPPPLTEWEKPSKTAAQEEIPPAFDTQATSDGDYDEILKRIKSPNFKFDLEKARAELARRDSSGAPKPQPSASTNPLTSGKLRRP